jgi:hypothetical protein
MLYVLAEIQEILRSKFGDRSSIVTELFLLLGIAGISFSRIRVAGSVSRAERRRKRIRGLP